MKLFGPAESSPRRVKNLFQSKVFDTVDHPCVTKIAATKAMSTYTRMLFFLNSQHFNVLDVTSSNGHSSLLCN